MELTELKQLWQSSNDKLEKSLVLHQKNTEDITKIKLQNFIYSMRPIKIFTLVIGIIWVLTLGTIVVNLARYALASVSLFFLFSAGLQILLTAISIWVYTYQLVLIQQVDLSKPIIIVQESLTKLKTSTLWVTRILFLQFPLWTTFYWNESMFENGNALLWVLQGFITLLFAFVSIWFFVNIKYENKDKKWFQWIFNGKEWQPIISSMELLEEVEKFKRE